MSALVPGSHVAGPRRVPGARAGSRPPGRAGAWPRLTARRRLRTAELFAGIGGFRVALDGQDVETVFACENDPVARRTYEANFRRRDPTLFASGRFAGDIRAVKATDVPAFDILTAGFPCQPFSVAGARRGFGDPRGTLFFEIVRLMRAKRPAAFILENVAGLRSQDGGRTFATIQHALESELGYSFRAKVLRASDFGLPQLRPRLFMVGFRDPGTEFSWPDPVPLRFTLDELLGGVTGRTVARTVLASHRRRGLGKPFAWDSYLVDGREHRLTLDQVRALQGFPADFVWPVPNEQAFQQLGNAVAVPVAAAVARSVLSSLRCADPPGALPRGSGDVVTKAGS